MDQLLSTIQAYLPYAVYLIPVIAGICALLAHGRFKGFARDAVAAAYRMAIATVEQVEDIGIEWLQSAEGKDFRRAIALRAYDALPNTMFGVPTGLIKVFVSRDQWAAIVQAAFDEMVDLAKKIDFPDELPHR